MKKNHVTILQFFLCRTDVSVISTHVQMHWLRVYLLESFCIHHHLAHPGSGRLVAGAAVAVGHPMVPSPAARVRPSCRPRWSLIWSWHGQGCFEAAVPPQSCARSPGWKNQLLLNLLVPVASMVGNVGTGESLGPFF